MQNCYVIIVNYKRWEDTVECLRCLFASSYPYIKALVVDNCSGNQSLENILHSFKDQPLFRSTDNAKIMPVLKNDTTLAMLNFSQLPDLLLVQHQRNAGFAAGNNLVLQYIQQLDGYVFLLNPDMTVHSLAIAALVAKLATAEKTVLGLVTKDDAHKEKILFYGGGTINYLTATVRMLRCWKPGNKIDYISGGALFTTTSTVREVGLLPEDYFLYWEETDWCRQAVQKEVSLEVCTDAICYDKVSTVIGRGFLSDYYYTRNGLLFLKKYAWWGIPTAILVTFVRITKRMLMGEWSRARGMFKGIVDFLI